MFRIFFIIFSGSAVGALLSLTRNLLIAQLIPVADYGIAATFAMAMSVVEMISTLGMQQQIIQSKQGNDQAFQAGLQGFHLLRGLIAGSVLFFAADWVAAFLGVPDVAWAYQVIAVVPILNGLQHFDIHRLKREMRFGPEILCQTVPLAFTLAMVWFLFVWFGDFRVMLVAIVLQYILATGLSHWVAERSYSLSFNRNVIGAAIRFGWPLLINNILLFSVFNGEKIVVARELGMIDLGILAMGFTLTLTPTLVIARTAQNFFLPQLSSVQENNAQFETLSRVTLQGVIAAALLFLCGVTLFGRPVVDLIFGEKYSLLLPLITLLGVMQTLRVIKAAPAIVALSRAQTSNAMWANIVRLLALPLAWFAAINGAGLLEIIWYATFGEFIGLIVSFGLLVWHTKISLRAMYWPLLISVTVIGVACWVAISADPSALWPGTLETLILLVFLGLALWSLSDLRQYVRHRKLSQ